MHKGCGAILLALLVTVWLAACSQDEGADDIGALDESGAQDAAEPLVHAGVFVAISDVSDEGGAVESGVAIDAVAVTREGVLVSYASTAELYHHSGGVEQEGDPSVSLGAPDVFVQWPSSDVCSAEGNALNLGGSGGYLVLHVAAPVQEGDVLHVFDAARCEANGSGTLASEGYRVEILYDECFCECDTPLPWVSLGEDSGAAVDAFALPLACETPWPEH